MARRREIQLGPKINVGNWEEERIKQEKTINMEAADMKAGK